MAGRAYPTLEIVEEGMRDGLQIESESITIDERVRLLDALSATGLRHIVVGSFVSPRWTPQMAGTEEVIRRMTPAPGVTYSALALNAKGVERRAAFVPPLTVDSQPAIRAHACDVFAQRNTNRTAASYVDDWPQTIATAKGAGARTAKVELHAGFGSNWVGDFSHEHRMELLGRQVEAWQAAGIEVDHAWLGDPMGWNTPDVVERLVCDIRVTWPTIRRIHLHLHNARGAAMTSAYAALRALDADVTLVVDTSIGGIGGCPYCGNGRTTGMIPTEDFVDLVTELGIDTGIDRRRLIDAALLAADILGRTLDGKVARAGTRPRGADLYAMDMPFVETFEEASHFRNGPGVYAHQRSPWAEPITSPQRDEVDRSLADVVPQGNDIRQRTEEVEAQHG